MFGEVPTSIEVETAETVEEQKIVWEGQFGSPHGGNTVHIEVTGFTTPKNLMLAVAAFHEGLRDIARAGGPDAAAEKLAQGGGLDAELKDLLGF